MVTEPTIEEQYSALTAADYRQAHTDLQAAGIPFDAVYDDAGQQVNVYHFEDFEFAIPVPPEEVMPEPGTVTPNLAVGWDGGETYISFNHTDQTAFKAGTAWVMVAAITALSPPAGLIAGFAVTVAGEYVNDYGFCPGNDELWVYFADGPTGPSYSQIICRPVSYPGGG